jgi:hypothetical protein
MALDMLSLPLPAALLGSTAPDSFFLPGTPYPPPPVESQETHIHTPYLTISCLVVSLLSMRVSSPLAVVVTFFSYIRETYNNMCVQWGWVISEDAPCRLLLLSDSISLHF